MEPALLQQVLALPDDERRLVANKIIESFVDEFEDDREALAIVNAELEKRMASVTDGTAEFVQYKDVQRGDTNAVRRFNEKQKEQP